MSLVNDMLRDLEQRHAAPTERLQLDGLYAVDEAAAARRERNERIRRGAIWFMAVLLIAMLVGLMIGKVMRTYGPLQPSVATAPEPQAPVAVPAPAQVLEVLPQHDGRGLVLQLLLDRSVAYQRTEESGAVSLLLRGVQLLGETQRGQVRREGSSLSWRVESRGEDVQILLVGLGERLDVHDRLEPAGDRWLLWIEIPLNPTQATADDELEAQQLATAVEAEAEDSAELPDWLNAPVAPADAPEPVTVTAPAPAPVAVSPPAAIPGPPPQVKIEPYRPDALTLARQAMQDGDYPGAIRQLEALQASRSRDPEVLRWLARAYLGGGEQARLLAWLPGQLSLLPQDSELRLLLGRAQLQAGDHPGAVATLEHNAPPLVQEPTYHALLAASYQQTRQWRESAALYQRLVELQPKQATWQLGLAIALEQLDQPAVAGRHYRLAVQGQGLDDSAKRFANERATALGGR